MQMDLHLQKTQQSMVTFTLQVKMLNQPAVIEGTVTGAQEVSAGEADVVTTASIVNDAEGLAKAASKDGTWIVAAFK